MPNRHLSTILCSVCLAALVTAGCATHDDVKSSGDSKSSGRRSDNSHNRSGEITSSGTIKLTIPKHVTSAFLMPLDNPPANLKQAVLDSAKKNLDGQSNEVIRKLIESGDLSFREFSAKEAPLPPSGLLSANGCSKEQEAVLRGAQKFVMVLVESKPEWPPIGEIYASSAASAFAHDHNCLILDLRLLQVSSPSQPTKNILPHKGQPRFTDRILLLVSPSKSGDWYTTKGLDLFGLPELQLFDAPPNLSPNISRILNGLAWKLVSLSISGKKDSDSDIFELPSTIELTAEDIDKACQAVSQAKGKVNLHLRLDKETTDSPEFLTITVPPGEVASTGEYLSSVCKQLFGQTDSEVVFTKRTSEMDAAMAKARASLPEIRARFIAGKLPKGAGLVVKFPFEYQGDTEFLWAYVSEWEKPEILNCHCANDSDLAPTYKVGQPLELKASSIADWMVEVNGKQTEGGFTNKVLRQK